MFYANVSMPVLPCWETAVWSVVCILSQMPFSVVTLPQTAQTAAAPGALLNLSPMFGSVGSSWRLTAPVAGPYVDLKKGTNPKPACDFYGQKPISYRTRTVITFIKGKRGRCIWLMPQNCCMLWDLDSWVHLSSSEQFQIKEQLPCSNSANLFAW